MFMCDISEINTAQSQTLWVSALKILTFHNQFQQMRRRPRNWCTGFPPLSCYCTGDHTVVVLASCHSPATAQETTQLLYWLPATLLYCTDHTVVVLSCTAEFTLSSVKLPLSSFINCGNCFHVLENEISFNHLISFILPNSVCIILKMNSHTFHDFGNKFTFLLLVFHKSAGPHRCCALMTELDVKGSFISPN